MKCLTLMIFAVALLTACGGDPDECPRDPESFVPVDVLEQAESPLARECLAHLYMLVDRIAECDVNGLFDHQVNDAWPALCNDLPESGPWADVLGECLDTWANGSCSDLAGPDALVPYEGCSITDEW